jgi:hypothetical protein
MKRIPNPKIVYKKDYAIKMIAMGHKLLETMPNPYKQGFICWIFEDDKDFDEDLNRLIKGDQHE